MKFTARTADGQTVELDAVDYADAAELAAHQGMTMTNPTQPRTLATIAREIGQDPAYSACKWCAEPYRSAMATLDSLADSYGADDARSIVIYLLANLGQWRGDTARRIKAELKAMLKVKK